MTANWIADTNRFKLEVPPEWWLKALWDFDAQLVVIPSRAFKKYLLARRRQYTAGIGDVAMVDNKAPDTNMLYAHGLLPVAALNFSGQWTLTPLKQLAERDTWALGGGRDGADTVIRIVEDHEAQQEIDKWRRVREDLRYRAREGYRSLQTRLGRRNKTYFDGNRHAKIGGARRERRIQIALS